MSNGNKSTSMGARIMAGILVGVLVLGAIAGTVIYFI
jgi:hypothetical protein